MIVRALLVGLLLSAGALPAVSGGVARADGDHRDGAIRDQAPTRAAALAERSRLQAELDRVNAEIDALKRSRRGLRDDYRLRSRMADAEALAHRLTDLDQKLGLASHGGAGIGDGAAWAAAPRATASDDRADLEAKADILADQAGRVASQATVLGRRVADLQGRRELRRRAGQLEHDPFSPLEQSKHRVGLNNGSSGSNGPMSAAGGSKESVPGVSGTPSPGNGTTAPPVMGNGNPGPLAPGGATSATTGRSTDSSGAGSATTPIITPVPSTAAADSPGSLAAQFHGILDPASLAEIRRLETAGPGAGGAADLPAMERALAALRARAAELAAEAASLRARGAKTR